MSETLYTRSSFIDWLRTKRGCKVEPLRDSRGLIVRNGVEKIYIWYDRKNRIDYDEIWTLCNKLLISGLPGDSELERIE